MIDFGERFRKARIRSGLSQKQVMYLIGVSDKSLSRYETNSTTPDLMTIRNMIQLYDVSADYILGLTNEMGSCNKDCIDGTSLTPPFVAAFNVYDALDELSDKARSKAEEYIEMLRILDEVRSGSRVIESGDNKERS